MIDELLHHGLEQQAKAQPESLAIKQNSIEYSYGHLDDLANCAAHGVLDRIGYREALIAVISADPVVQLSVAFAVWKIGMTVLILDSNEPEGRLKQILEDAGALLVVAGSESTDRAARLSKDYLVFEPRQGSPKSGNFDELRNPDHPAAIIYTSGSTGQPKGVVRTHRNLLVEIRHDAAFFPIADTDHVSLMLPLNFSFGLKCALTALLSGASLFSFRPLAEGLTPFSDWLGREEITVLIPPVSYFRSFLHTLTTDVETGACRCVILGGENLYKADVENFRRVFGANCRLFRTYGMTEAGTVSCIRIDEAMRLSDPVPVGYPVDYVTIRIIDEKHLDKAAGETGEIAVVGANLPPGYWKNPDLTHLKYRTLSDDGHLRMCLTGDIGWIGQDGLLFLQGRKDAQQKIRGYRVDLGEIETALNDIDGVAHAVVVAVEDGSRGKRISAFVSLSGEPKLELKSLRRLAAARLPAYMLPQKFIIVDKIPFTSRGKVNRPALVSIAANLSKGAVHESTSPE